METSQNKIYNIIIEVTDEVRRNGCYEEIRNVLTQVYTTKNFARLYVNKFHKNCYAITCNMLGEDSDLVTRDIVILTFKTTTGYYKHALDQHIAGLIKNRQPLYDLNVIDVFINKDYVSKDGSNLYYLIETSIIDIFFAGKQQVHLLNRYTKEPTSTKLTFHNIFKPSDMWEKIIFNEDQLHSTLDQKMQTDLNKLKAERDNAQKIIDEYESKVGIVKANYSMIKHGKYGLQTTIAQRNMFEFLNEKDRPTFQFSKPLHDADDDMS